MFISDDGASPVFEISLADMGDSLATVDFSGFDPMGFEGMDETFIIEIDDGQ